MTTPQISSKLRFHADIKGHCLPVTFTIPPMPKSSLSEEREPLGPSYSRIFPDKDPHIIDSGTTIQHPQDVVTNTGKNTGPQEIDVLIEHLDLSHLSVSRSLCCTFII